MGVLGAEGVVAGDVTWGDWLAAAVVFVGGIAVGRVIRLVLRRVLGADDAEEAAPDVAGRLVGYVFVLAGLVYGLASLDVRIGPLLGALGIGGIAVAFAAQTILSNFLASVLLQTRRPFRRGDQIATNGLEGTVEDVNFRTVVLRTFDGERVFVPASSVLNAPILNYTARGSRRTTLDVGVAYRTDLQKAQAVLLQAVTSVEGVRERPGPEAWVAEFGDSSIDFAVRYWHAPDIATLWRVRSDVAMAVKQGLDDAGIEIPFPQRVVNVVEDRTA